MIPKQTFSEANAIECLAFAVLHGLTTDNA